jgi:hypothetical protein
MNKKWKQIGNCAVDSGMLIISDPCYVLPKIGDQIEYTYDDLLRDSFDGEKDTLPKEVIFKDKSGNGVAVRGFGGDGNYPVYIKRDINGTILEIKILFNQ